MGLLLGPNVNVLGFTPTPLLLLLLCLLHVALSSSAAPGAGICSSAIVSHGYKCQEFDVVTPDGYILKLIRIPEGLALEGSASAGGARQPVLIQHGVLVDGLSWLLNSPEQNLPFILADNGFDVWISNTRGTRFSRRHTSLDPAYQEYWDWSWDELVSHDLPAMFDFVHAQTGSKVDYVGHSLGTLTALMSLSEGLLGDKIRSAALLSPIAYLSHMTTALGVVAARAFLGEITTLFGLAEFDPKGEPVGHFIRVLCAFPEVVCYDLLSAITGQNCCLNTSTTDSFIKIGPQPTSTKNMVHLSQTVRDGVLTMYDYGIPAANIMHYGDSYPPAYNLSNISRDLPMFLSYGAQDALSDVRDVEQLLSKLRFHNPGRLVVQRVEDYGHADFIMAVNAKDVVYKSVVSFFKNQW